MRKTLPHLSQQQITQLATLVQKIRQVLQPELIFCFGSRTTTMQDWSCFWEEEGYQETIFPTTFDLLILPGSNEKRADHEIIQLIEQQSELLDCNVTCVVEKFSTFTEALEKGYRFDNTVYRKGVLIYNGNGLLLPAPAPEPDAAIIKNKIVKHWNQCFTIAQRFFKSATNCLNDNWPEQAAFNLHQSVQHACMALLRVYTGYRSTTHNLSRLLALIENFTFEPSAVFPCLTKEEKELFTLLNRAYSDARYNDHYSISAEKIAILMERVKELLSIAETLYKENLEQLSSKKTVSFPLTHCHEEKA
jgi:HEPN domain-containing protein